MLWDTHMHSQYSGDSDAPQEDMIRAAIRAKLPGICFTDHLDIDYKKEGRLYQDEEIDERECTVL